jgi:AraC-like DNA-binding protein
VLLQFFQFSVQHRVTPSYHDYLEVSLVCAGRGRFIVENRVHTVSPGDVLLIGRREFHRMEAETGSALRVASLHFRPELLHAAGEAPLGFEYLKPFVYRGPGFSHRIERTALPDGLVAERMRRLHEESLAGQPDYPLAARTYLADILFEVSRCVRLRHTHLVPQDRRVRDFERLLEVFSYVRKNCHEPLTLRQLAPMAHMTPGHFCRFFKATTGHTLTEYLLRLRVDLAMDFLSNSAMSVTDIAYASGFSSHSYFDRVFKRMAGMTPLDYRRQLKV